MQQREIQNLVMLAFLKGGAQSAEDAAKYAHCTIEQVNNAIKVLNREAVLKTGKPMFSLIEPPQDRFVSRVTPDPNRK
jgi:hypothetical protein